MFTASFKMLSKVATTLPPLSSILPLEDFSVGEPEPDPLAARSDNLFFHVILNLLLYPPL